jgi:hypothetical protein
VQPPRVPRLLFVYVYVCVFAPPARARERHREAIDFCEGLGSWAPGRFLVAISIAASTPRSIVSPVQSSLPRNPNASIHGAPRASSTQYNMLRQTSTHGTRTLKLPPPRHGTENTHPAGRWGAQREAATWYRDLRLSLESTRPCIHSTLHYLGVPCRTALQPTLRFPTLPAPLGRPATHLPRPVRSGAMRCGVERSGEVGGGPAEGGGKRREAKRRLQCGAARYAKVV